MIPIGASSDKYFFLAPFHCFLCYPDLSTRDHYSLYVPSEPHLPPRSCHAGYLVRRVRPSAISALLFSFSGSYTCTLLLGNGIYRRFIFILFRV
ncbi:uncharacterized protein BO88DRAFT_18548 [Aspergillus vadensis CBS 113365]|uniref:Uncharacterized protein n=1 Tax=Aspergillus vadensis (strain CBS 113365 / IMI 142717 / IBT 24658) TaxID=1448311 RepID=A0A319BMV4_ASPVC|nr:hypothetical protein BO88DRAFT_18548 [Aspergillus vadensis CBS 113365]PYH74646.1 hypothetical protein BO88DRAFT_18548 [Aspergillus vadensis CBS 113365]